MSSVEPMNTCHCHSA